MRIGLLPTPSRSVSVRHVMTSVKEALAAGHELVYADPSIAFASDAEQHRLAGELIERCDALLGIVHPSVLTMRQRMGSRVPYFLVMLGTMGRGAFRFRHYLPQLTTSDTLIVNCEADRRISERLIENAYAPVVPLAYDDRTYHPLDEAERAEIRADLGFDERARLLLYAGRVMPEKNLHTVFRAFRALMPTHPDLNLVLAGRIQGAQFEEFGVTPANFPQTLGRISTDLGIPAERILSAGAVSPTELREFYNVADVAINLTLHHDENFGLAQVEAMACGLPVVGSLWGGLKDTIEDGRTGYGVSAVPGPLGVKVDWWEAASRVASILQDPEARAAFREDAPRRARAKYSQERLRLTLDALLAERVAQAAEGEGEPLRPTAFGEEFWATCDPASDPRPPYRRGARSMELYRGLIEPFTGLSPLAVPVSEPLAEGQLLTLATPVTGGKQGGFWQDDPLYPLAVEVPGRYVRSFEKLLAAFSAEPVVPFARLRDRVLSRAPDAARALEWMVENGVVLRSVEGAGCLDPAIVPRDVARPLFAFQRLPPQGVDFIVSA